MLVIEFEHCLLSASTAFAVIAPCSESKYCVFQGAFLHDHMYVVMSSVAEHLRVAQQRLCTVCCNEELRTRISRRTNIRHFKRALQCSATCCTNRRVPMAEAAQSKCIDCFSNYRQHTAVATKSITLKAACTEYQMLGDASMSLLTAVNSELSTHQVNTCAPP